MLAQLLLCSLSVFLSPLILTVPWAATLDQKIILTNHMNGRAVLTAGKSQKVFLKSTDLGAWNLKS